MPTEDAQTAFAISLRRLLWVVPVLVAVGVTVQHPDIRTAVIGAVIALVWILVSFDVRVPIMVVIVVSVVGAGLLMLQSVPNDLAGFFLVYLLAVAASETRPLVSVGLLAISAGFVVGLGFAERNEASEIWALGMAVSWSGGSLFRLQEKVMVETRLAQEATMQQAVVEERAHIARELHDVIGHSVAVMMLHLTGARRALTRDPKDAARALELAEAAGRESMAEIRKTVSVLGPDAAGTTVALPGAVDIPQLVEQFRRAGMTITVRIGGELAGVSATTGLALYRVVEESLTNASKHAPDAPVTVDLDVSPTTETLVVRNPVGHPPNGRRGVGLRSMEDRARQLGGTLTAGPHGREWRVEARIPTSEHE